MYTNDRYHRVKCFMYGMFMSENLGPLRHTILNVELTFFSDQEMPESILQAYCVVKSQMPLQDEFLELHFVPDPVLWDDGT